MEKVEPQTFSAMERSKDGKMSKHFNQNNLYDI